MTYEEDISLIMKFLHIADAKAIAGILYTWYPKRYKNFHSCYVQVQKNLQYYVEFKKLKKGKNGTYHYSLPHCKSDFHPHAQSLTYAQARILSLFPDAQMFRELYIQELNLRPDCLVYLTHKGHGYCFILEIANLERMDSLKSKGDIWNNWQSATQHLSKLFNTKIPSFYFVVEGIGSDQGLIALDQFINTIKED